MNEPKHPLTRFPETTLILPPAFLGSISRYALIASTGQSFVDTTSRFDKRFKSAHRTTIADVNGPMRLTLPIGKPESIMRAKWNDIKLSDHGQWWHLHMTALESAYGRTPFFEYYIDSFAPFFRNEAITEYNILVNFDSGLEDVICHILGIDAPKYKSLDRAVYPANSTVDLSHTEPRFEIPTYYQVRADRLGFIPDLSVLDLIFNMGPEAPLVLQKVISSINKF